MTDGYEFFAYEEGFDETVLASEIIKISILYNPLKEVMSFSKKNGRNNQSLDFLYTLYGIIDILKIAPSYLSPDSFIGIVLPGETRIMEKGCQKEIGLIFQSYSFFITEISDTRIHIKGVVDVVIGVVIDRIKEIEYIPKCTVDYFLFIHPYEDNENKILPHSIYQE